MGAGPAARSNIRRTRGGHRVGLRHLRTGFLAAWIIAGRQCIGNRFPIVQDATVFSLIPLARFLFFFIAYAS